MMIHWPFMIACSILALVTLPGTIELAMITFAGILPPHDRKGSDTDIAKLAVVVPAHNEAAAIARCVRSIAACIPPEALETEIVVIADNCTDATADFARAAGARVLVRSDSTRQGKGFALKFAFEVLLGEAVDAVLVVDADSMVDPDFLVESVRLFRAGADGVQARYLVLNSDASPRTRLMNVAFMAFNVLRARGRERLGLSAGISGNGFGLSRATLLAIPYETHSLVEDLDYHLRIVEAGRRISFADRTGVRAEMPIGGRGASTQRAMGGRTSADRGRQSATTGCRCGLREAAAYRTRARAALVAARVSRLAARDDGADAVRARANIRSGRLGDSGRPYYGWNSRRRRRLGRFCSPAERASVYRLETRRPAENSAIGAGRGPLDSH
jgi:Glycosyltransferase like family 2